MAEVVLEGVTKVYPGHITAVDRLSLTIADREFVVLVGPSGCGKSTTLRMIAGLEDLTAGTIRIGGRVVNDLPPKDRDIAMVFQNYALYPHMTVYSNMAFGLLLRRRHAGWGNPFGWLLSRQRYRQAREERAEIQRRVQIAAATLGIEDLLARRPRALSGGQRQRVAVGRAIVRHPKAFLFDEPLSNLDAKLRVEMRAELKRLHRMVQTTTIYVTHDQEEAMTLGDCVVVMKEGVVHQAGTPFDVYRSPVNRFVAGFLGTPPMNFVAGRIVRRGDRLAFRPAGGDELLLTAPHTARLAAYVDRPVTMGVRPEWLRLEPAAPAGSTLRVLIDVVEPLGERMDVHARLGENPLVCRLDASAPVREGQTVPLLVDLRRVHFFEPEGVGRNLSLSSEQTPVE